MPDIEECQVSLCFWDDGLDPSRVSRLLGHLPAFGRRKGERYLAKNGDWKVATTGAWQITTGWRVGVTLESLIHEILAELPSDISVWRGLRQMHQGTVFCGLLLGSLNEEAALSSEVLMAIAERGLQLRLDIYDSELSPPSP